MGFQKLRAFPITAVGNDGYPSLGTPIPLLTPSENETELNNVQIVLTPTTKEKTLNADDKEAKHISTVGYEGSIEVYGVDESAIAAILESIKDANGNIIHKVNTGVEKPVCLFYEGKNEKGKKFQQWLFYVVFKPFETTNKTETDSTETITLEFTGRIITTNDGEISHATVYEGNEGWVTGEPTATDIYKEAVDDEEIE